MIDPSELQEKGYIIVPDLVPEQLLQPVIKAITDFLDVNLDDPTTWYQKNLGSNGIVPIHHHQAFWDIRQYEPVYRLYADLLKTDDLWVRLDRASFKPPWRPEHPDKKDDSQIHLDSHPEKVFLPRYQGILYLTDTAENQGAFCCVPSLYTGKQTTLDRNSLLFTDEDLKGHDIVHLAGKAGTFILWDSRLPHASSLNHHAKPRLTQYISMFPAGTEDNREERIQLWRDKRAPERWRNFPYQQDPEPGEPAKLTPVGEQLLGLTT
ncbi:phytanoyl-CoA dioxygenase family protein [Endozoicomonas sp. YOMI1]|uniref:phytanoyl-CoA dioxygenase family protein n=1 Tax=Endozoicomonas sp. YOMI1 TaxID=2828739 RepID=UPI002148D367|nr:phytanoyl-CoA dioxygenase family protein [Endozoicomonas sp. YOMI1]